MMLAKCIFLLLALSFVYTKPLTKETVRQWASKIEEYLAEVAEEGLRTRELQKMYDKASYIDDRKNGSKTVEAVKKRLGGYFSKKEHAAKRLAEETAKLSKDFNIDKKEHLKYSQLRNLPKDLYSDTDLQNYNPVHLPKYNILFKQVISLSQSAVKISDQSPREHRDIIDTVEWSAGLDKIFKQNLGNDSDLRWQYFGSNEGLYRMYPGRKWQTNFAGFYEDYDPRVRPWYISATSGPKDVVIVLDCSYSMKGKKFEMAKSIAITVLNTLTKQDYVNIVCGHKSHWDEVGKHKEIKETVLSCQQNRLVPASTSHRKDLSAKIDNLVAEGATKLKDAFVKAFDLLSGSTGTGCQSFIIFVTDGLDTDGDKIRCGKGYYTRSGYVPGPKCQYNWNDVWSAVEKENKRDTRIFSYLVVDDGEEFPGKLACDNRGFMKKIVENSNLISQMQDYYNFLTANTETSATITWSPPYLDALGMGLMVTAAVPVVTNRTIGVIGVDVTLDEIENILTGYTWGSAYAFLINNEGETIFHPLLRPSTQLVDDPIFVEISELEQKDADSDSVEKFRKVVDSMKEGKTGQLRIENAYRTLPKGDFQDGLENIKTPVTYFYSGIEDSTYSFAFSFTDSDLNYRRPDKPSQAIQDLPTSYYGHLKSYNTNYVRKELGPLCDSLDLQYNTDEYPDQYISRHHSSVFIAAKGYCDANKYLFNDNSSQLTVQVHKLINNLDNPTECNTSGTLLPGSVRSDVLITAPIETQWKARNQTIVKDVRWTYVATIRGAFRNYPGHRSPRNFDPTRRPWYHRTIVNPSKISVSNAYMDVNGIGKVVTISQAVFEGISTSQDCNRTNRHGGCACYRDSQCLSRYCREGKCTGDRVEAVVALDIKYTDFHQRIYERLKTSGEERSCGAKYTCPDGVHTCETRCYLVDNSANLVTDPDFLEANITDEREYQRVSLGRKEGDIMKQFVQNMKLFEQTKRFDYQGKCSVSPYFPKVTLKGIIQTPEEEDEYYRNKGPIPPFQNEYGCIQDVIGYNATLFQDDDIFVGNSSGPCTSGNYFFTSLPKTNLYLLVIENWTRYRQSFFYNFNCHISNQVFDAGAFRIVNGTCKHIDHSHNSRKKETCPKLRDIDVKCTYNRAARQVSCSVFIFVLVLKFIRNI